MMHKFFRFTMLVALLAGAFSLNAQSSKPRPLYNKAVVPAAALKAVPAPKPSTGLEFVVAQPAEPSIPVSQSIFRSITEDVIGNSNYDNQSNGAESARVHAWDNGDAVAAWTQSFDAESSTNTSPAYADRGTGYNARKNGAWGPIPTTRLESVRTGFTNLVVTDDGTVFTVGHRGVDASHYRLYYTRRAAGSSTITQGDIPTNSPNGQLWSKAAVDGNTIYVIALSTIKAFNGVDINGLDGQVFLYRSKDAGLTWDKTDFIIPGLDASSYAQLSGDSYQIAASGGYVAVGVFDSWNDVKIWKSLDGGDTWEDPYFIIDFPLDFYVTDKGYTVDDIGGADPNAPNNDELAMFNTDGAVSMIIDALGNIQMFSGETYVVDDVLDDGTSSYYPGINGVMWWSEADAENLYEITGALDVNGNDTLDFNANSIVGYGTGMSSMPAAATDENGFVYVVYSANLENKYDGAGKAVRHLYAVKSVDLGQSWSFPLDLTYEANPGDSLTADISECVFPSAHKLIKGGKMHFVYQRDYNAGSAVQQTGVQPSLSDIVYVASAEIVSGSKSPNLNTIGMSINPNPANDFAQINFTLEQKGKTTVEVLDLAGQVVRTIASESALSGGQTMTLNTNTLTNGVYFVKVRSGNQQGVKKMIVMH